MTESGYGLGESLIETLVKTVTGFTAVNVARANWKPLNRGKAATYAIVYPADFARRVGRQQVTETFVTRVEIWQRYKDDGTTAIDLYAAADAVLRKIEAYPHLGDTSGYVVDSEPTLSLPEEMWTRGGGPAWLRQVINVRWTGQRIRTFLD